MKFASAIILLMMFAGCASQPHTPVTKDISLLFNNAYNMMEKDPEGAIRLLDEAIKAAPGMWQPHYNKAVIYAREEKLRKAEEEFSKALKYNRKSPEINNAIGNLYVKTDRLEKAGKMFAKALTYDKSGKSMMNLANLYQTIGDEKKAFEYYKQIDKEFPDTPLFHYNYAIHLYKKGDYIDALTELKKSPGIEKKEFKPLLLEIQILVKSGRIERALSSLFKLIDRYPEEPASYKHLGIVYEIYLGDMEKALYNYSKYKRLEKDGEKTVQPWIDVVKAKLALSTAESGR